MKIDVRLIKEQCKELTKIVNDLELNYLNVFNQINDSLNNIHDDKSSLFFEDISAEKKEIQKVLLNLEDLKKTYISIYKYYSEIALKITYFKENKDDLFNTFDNYLEKIDNVIKQIDNNTNENLTIKNLLITNQKIIKNVKKDCYDIINNIEKKESKIKELVSKLSAFKINEINFNKKM